MHRRSLLFVLVLLAAVAVPVAVSSPLQSFHLEKTCDGLGTCTVTSSSTGVLPKDTTETYFGPEYGYPVLSSRVVIATPDGGTAIGQCAWPYRSATGTCTFAGGTGSLTGFHANLSVSANGDFSVFYWDGTYHF